MRVGKKKQWCEKSVGGCVCVCEACDGLSKEWIRVWSKETDGLAESR